jgi:hypothetical protein
MIRPAMPAQRDVSHRPRVHPRSQAHPGRRRLLLFAILLPLATAVLLGVIHPTAVAAGEGRTPPRTPALAEATTAGPAAQGAAPGGERRPVQEEDDEVAPAGRPDARLLLLSLPGLTWAEVQQHELPNLAALFAESALADLAPRGVFARSAPGGAYLTISAGARATTALGIDGQQLGVDEQSAGSAAGEIFRRRTGTDPDGEFVSLAWPELVRANDDQPYDAELGALTDRLDAAGMGVAAIGNADGTDSVGPSYERQVGLAAIDGDGVVPAGALGDDLLEDDPSAPFGRRLDPDAVVARFEEAWSAPAGRAGGLVVVEASDLARTMRYRDRVDEQRYDELRAEALAATDELVGRLLASVEPGRDAVLAVAPYNLPRDRDLTVAALRAPGLPAGYLKSASTQRSGFLTLVDVGPTVLDRLDVERPAAMEGRPAEPAPSSADLDERIDRLVSLNAGSRFRERLLFPTTLLVVVGLALVCAAAVVVLVRESPPRARRWVSIAALANMAVLPLSYLARGFPLDDLGPAFYWAFVLVGAGVIALGATFVAERVGRPRVALAAVLGLMLGVLAVDVVTGSHLSLNAAFGYSPTGNSRLYGVSNYSFGQIAAAACLLAGLLGATRPARRGHLGALVLLVAVLLVVGLPLWGADVGGILAFTPTILLFAALIWGRRVSLRSVVVAGVVTVAAVTAIGFLDLARPAEERGHLGRLFERIGDEGLQPLTSVVERKLVANLQVTTSSFWVAAIPIAAAFVVFLVRYPTRPLSELRWRVPTLRAGLLAACLAAVLGSLVNDSGAIVGGVTVMVLAASLVCLVLEADAPADLAPARANGTAASAGAGAVADATAPAGSDTESDADTATESGTDAAIDADDPAPTAN